LEPEAWRTSSDGVSDVRRRQMTVMLLDHARVTVTEVLSDDHRRNAVHHRKRRPGVPQSVKRNRRRDLGTLYGLEHRRCLVVIAKGGAIRAPDQWLVSTSACAQLSE